MIARQTRATRTKPHLTTTARVRSSEARVVLACSHVYGFVTRFEKLHGRQKAGKSLLSLGRDSGARVLQPAQVAAVDTDRIVAVTSAEHLLAFPVSELPELDTVKGTKNSKIPKTTRITEQLVAIAAVSPGCQLAVK